MLMYSTRSNPTAEQIVLGIVKCNGACTNVVIGCRGSNSGVRHLRGGDDCPISEAFAHKRCDSMDGIYRMARLLLMGNLNAT